MRHDRCTATLAFTFLVAGVTGCGSEPAVAFVRLGLGAVPARVQDIALFVVDRAREEVVASATVAPPKTTFEIGVPAEVPLEFHAVARTARPAPRWTGGRMPAYVGRAERTIALDREIRPVTLRARPGGLLDLRFLRGRGVGGELRFTLLGTEARLPDRLRIDLDDPVSRVVRALEAGAWSGRVERADEFHVPGAAGLIVVPEQVVQAQLAVLEAPSDPEPADPVELRLDWRDAAGARLEPPLRVDGRLEVSLLATGFDAGGRARSASRVRRFATWVSAAPSAAVEVSSTRPRRLPAVPLSLVLSAPARIFVRVTVELEGGQILAGRTAANALGPGQTPGVPERLTLELEDPAELLEGTGLWLALVDAADRLATVGPQAAFDLNGSDPFAYLPAGRVGPLVGPARSMVLFRVAEVEGTPVEIRATVTSSTPPGTWSETLMLPRLPATR